MLNIELTMNTCDTEHLNVMKILNFFAFSNMTDSLIRLDNVDGHF